VLTYCNLAAPLFSLQSFYSYARGHCKDSKVSNCSGVCWEERVGDGGVLVLQDVGTMNFLHWRCEMWVDCVERKRSAKRPWSATAPCTFAAASSFQACLRACIFCMCVCIYVYVCMCADMYISMYMHVCMYLYIYAFIHTCMCMCMHICA